METVIHQLTKVFQVYIVVFLLYWRPGVALLESRPENRKLRGAPK